MAYERLTKDNACLLLVDHQAGLANGVRDHEALDFMAGVGALTKLAKALDIPTVVTASASGGPNGPILPTITTELPNAPTIHRKGEINAWSNEEFVQAVKATGRKKLIVAGISTEVCVTFLSLSAIADGYEVYAVIDASGPRSKLVQEVAIARLAQAGVVPITWMAVNAELVGDWRSPEAAAVGLGMNEYLPVFGNLMTSFAAAKAG